MSSSTARKGDHRLATSTLKRPGPTGAPTTKLDAGGLRIMWDQVPSDAWSWRLACVCYRVSSSGVQQQLDARTLGNRFSFAGVIPDDLIVFQEDLTMLGQQIVFFACERDRFACDVWETGFMEPVLAAEGIRQYLIGRIKPTWTALVLADPITMNFIDILLGRPPGEVTPHVLGGEERTCLVTLQGDSLGVPQVKEIQPDIFWGSTRLTREQLQTLGI